MEDVDLVRRLGRHRLAGLAVDAVTSAARWERDGWWRRSARNLVCLSLYFAGVPPRLIARLYAMKDTVFVFARAPRLGTVKRRLAREIGDRAALRFHRATLGPAAARACRRPAVRHRAGDHARPRPHRPPARGRGGGAGAGRSRRAHAARARPGPAGPRWWAATSPACAPPTCAAAFRALGRARACFGPAPDGGYWLVALGPRRPARPFAGVRWSTAHALADTLRTLPADAWRCCGACGMWTPRRT